jgi:hypothetical protein
MKAVRDRVSAVMTMGGLLVTVVSRLAGSNVNDLDTWTLVAGLAFAGLAVLTAYLLWPRFLDSGSHDPLRLIEQAEDPEWDDEAMEKQLILRMAAQYNGNLAPLRRMTRLYAVGLTLFVVEVVALVFDVRQR